MTVEEKLAEARAAVERSEQAGAEKRTATAAERQELRNAVALLVDALKEDLESEGE